MENIWTIVLGVVGLLGLAVLLVPAAHRLNFPFTVLLAVVGCFLAGLQVVVEHVPGLGILGDFLNALLGLKITSEAVLFIFLPALVFESALTIDVHRLMEDIGPLMLLAVVGLLISTAVVGCSLWAVSSEGLIACLLLGAIVSATDPVAVMAIFKDMRVPQRLAMLVEGESLFNDATAIVMFTLLSSMLMGASTTGILSGTLTFIKVFVGGVLVGYALGRLTGFLFTRIGKIPVVNTTLTISLAYFSFIIAEHYIHVSGVMAVLTAALTAGSIGRASISPIHWDSLSETWENIGFWANSLIFLLVGLAVPRILVDFDWSHWGYLVVLVVTAFVARAGVIFGMLPCLSWANLAAKVDTAFKTVMWWGGLRGAVSLALALAVIENPAFDQETRSFIGILVTGLVLFTLFVNATTIGKVVNLFRLNELSPRERAIRRRALALSDEHTRDQIATAIREYEVDEELARDLTEYYRDKTEAFSLTRERVENISEEDWVCIGLADLVNREHAASKTTFAEGFLAPSVVQDLLRQAEDLAEGLKMHGVEGYIHAVETRLGFDWRFQWARWLQSRLGYTGPLARRLADRFEVLLATRAILRKMLEEDIPRVVELIGQGTGAGLKRLLQARIRATNQAFRMLELQYPEYAVQVQKRFLVRMGLRMQESEYREMWEKAVISKDVYLDLEKEREALAKNFSGRLPLDLGLTPERLVARVPFFSHLPEDHLRKIVLLLKPRLALPGEIIVRKGDVGEAMYFISTGCVEADLESGSVHLGSGDFFGEIALLKKGGKRLADVIAFGFCDLLVLSARDFHVLLDTEPELKETILRVAGERLKLFELESLKGFEET